MHGGRLRLEAKAKTFFNPLFPISYLEMLFIIYLQLFTFSNLNFPSASFRPASVKVGKLTSETTSSATCKNHELALLREAIP
jgi:hypothetical protein